MNQNLMKRTVLSLFSLIGALAALLSHSYYLTGGGFDKEAMIWAGAAGLIVGLIKKNYFLGLLTGLLVGLGVSVGDHWERMTFREFEALPRHQDPGLEIYLLVYGMNYALRAAAISFILGVILASRARRAVVGLIVGYFAVLTLFIAVAFYFEKEIGRFLGDGSMGFLVVLCALVGITVPVSFGVLFGTLAGGIFRPGMLSFADLRPYLDVMIKPVAGFFIGYLFLIFTFAGFYASLNTPQGGAVTCGSGTIQKPRYQDLLYYSVVTITTVGYGDCTPQTGAAKFLASAEAVIGVSYVVVIFGAIAAYLNPKFQAIANMRRRKDEGIDEGDNEKNQKAKAATSSDYYS